MLFDIISTWLQYLTPKVLNTQNISMLYDIITITLSLHLLTQNNVYTDKSKHKNILSEASIL